MPETASPTAPERVGVKLVAWAFTMPVALASPADGTGRLFVADLPGVIRVIDAGGLLLDEPFLDITDRVVKLRPGYDERGLLGLAFHPEFAENRRFFVYYSAPLRAGAPRGWDHTSRISEFAVSAGDENQADPGSERVILEVDQPQSNHNGGIEAVVIGGYVYRGSALPAFRGRYVFGEWNRAGADGDGIVFVATPPEDPNDMWAFTEVEVAGSRTVGAYVLAFGEDAEHELYVMTSENQGPTGKTGRVCRLVPPSEPGA